MPLVGRRCAALFLHTIINVSTTYGSNYPEHRLLEGALPDGGPGPSVSWSDPWAPLGHRRDVGLFGAIEVGGYIALAGLWGSPISGASMNPARTFGPDLVGTDFTSYWVYVVGPLVGAVLAVGVAYVLRGSGGGKAGSGAAQGDLNTQVEHPDKA